MKSIHCSSLLPDTEISVLLEVFTWSTPNFVNLLYLEHEKSWLHENQLYLDSVWGGQRQQRCK